MTFIPTGRLAAEGLTPVALAPHWTPPPAVPAASRKPGLAGTTGRPLPPAGPGTHPHVPGASSPPGSTGGATVAGALPGEGRAPATWTGHTCTLSPSLMTAAARMSEDGPGGVEEHLRRYLKDFGLGLAYHPWKLHAQKAREGYPDWTIAGPGGLIFRELKRQNREPTGAQEKWLVELHAAGQDVGVWKPCCVHSGRMASELGAVATARWRS